MKSKYSLTYRFLLYTLLLLMSETSFSSFSLEKDTTRNRQLSIKEIYKIPLVHGTFHIPNNGIQVTGLTIALQVPEGEVIPSEACFRIRATGHYCLGGVVPPHDQGNWEDRPYWIIEHLNAFKGKLFGGNPEDIFFIGDKHELSTDSIFIAPEQEQEKIRQEMQEFKGTLLFYPSSTIPRNFIEKLFEEKGWNRIKYSDFNEYEHVHETIRINEGEKTSWEESLGKLYQDAGFYMGLHHGSRMAQIEDILSDLTEPLIYHYLQVEQPEVIYYPSTLKDLKALQTLLQHHFNALQDMPIFSDQTHAFLRKWQQEIADWMPLLELDVLLREKHKKSLFQSKQLTEKFIERRYNLGINSSCFLEEAEKELEYTSAMGIEGYDISWFLYPMSPQEITSIAPLWEAQGYDSSLLIVQYVFKRFLNNHREEDLLTLFAENIFKINREEFPDLGQTLLFSFFSRDDEEGHVSLLRRFNESSLKESFGHLLNTKEFEERDFTFDDLLKHSPNTQLLYKDDGYITHDLFIRQKMRTDAKPKTLEEASEKTRLYLDYSEQLKAPINSSLTSEQTEGNIYTLMKEGNFGPLSEIFTMTGIKDLFPNEEDFWTSTQSLYEILEKVGISQ